MWESWTTCRTRRLLSASRRTHIHLLCGTSTPTLGFVRQQPDRFVVNSHEWISIFKLVCNISVEGHATSKAEPRADADAEQKEQRREKSRESRAAEAQRPKPAEFRAERERENTSRNAGEKRSYIGSARACGVTVAKRTSGDLTPLIGSAQARGCARRARAQRRSLSTTQARGVHKESHVMKAAYISATDLSDKLLFVCNDYLPTNNHLSAKH